MRLWDKLRNPIVTGALRLAYGSSIKVQGADRKFTDIDLNELLSLNNLSATDLAKIDGITNGTGAAGKALVLDSNGDLSGIPGIVDLDGNDLAAAPGAGFAATGTLVKGGVVKVGDLITTRIFLDLTGLASIATDGDIIGENGAGDAYFTQITAAVNGTIFGGWMRCLEAPTTGEPDIDVYAADEGTADQDDGIGGLSNTAKVFDPAADWTLALEKALTAVPGADQYLYLTCGNGGTPDAGTYDAGKFLIELWGYDA